MTKKFIHDKIKLSTHLLIREIDEDIVILNLQSKRFYGLDAIGGDIWKSLANLGSVRLSYEKLLMEYDVNPEKLHQDIEQLLSQWLEQGLIQISDPSERIPNPTI